MPVAAFAALAVVAAALIVMGPLADAYHTTRSVTATLEFQRNDGSWTLGGSSAGTAPLLGHGDRIRVVAAFSPLADADCHPSPGSTTVAAPATNTVSIDVLRWGHGQADPLAQNPTGSSNWELPSGSRQILATSSPTTENGATARQVEVNATTICTYTGALATSRESILQNTAHFIAVDREPHKFPANLATLVTTTAQGGRPATTGGYAYPQIGIGGSASLPFDASWTGLDADINGLRKANGATPRITVDASKFNGTATSGFTFTYTRTASFPVTASSTLYDAPRIPITVVDRADNANTTTLVFPLDNIPPGPTNATITNPTVVMTATPTGTTATLKWTYSKVDPEIVGVEINTATASGTVTKAVVQAPRATQTTIGSLQTGRPHVFEFTRVDDAANREAASTRVSTTPHPVAFFVSPNQTTSTPLVINPTDLAVVKVKLTEQLPPNVDNLTFFMRRADGQYWNGVNTTSTPTFQADWKGFPAWKVPAANQELSIFRFKTSTAVMDWPSGTYTLGMRVRLANGNAYNLTQTLSIDKNAPKTDTSVNALLTPSIRQHERLAVRFSASEREAGESGLKNITAFVLDTTGTKPRADWRDATGTTLLVQECANCTAIIDTKAPLATKIGKVGLNRTVNGPNVRHHFTQWGSGGHPLNISNKPFGYVGIDAWPGLPVGKHKVLVRAWDNASSATPRWVAPQVLDVLPRVAAPASDPARIITVSGTQRLVVEILAAYDNRTDANGQLCPGNVCKPAEVRLYARDGTGAYPTTPLRTVTQPEAGTITVGGLQYYRYIANFTGFPTIEPLYLRFEAVARSTNAAGNTYEYTGRVSDIIVARDASTSNVAVRYPPQNWALNFTGDAGKVRFNASITLPSWESVLGAASPATHNLPKPPILHYTVLKVDKEGSNAGKYLNLSTGTFHTGDPANPAPYTLQRNANLTHCGVTATCATTTKWSTARYTYNYSSDLRHGFGTGTTGAVARYPATNQWVNGAAIPRGEYLLNITFKTATGAELATTSRYFAVETNNVAVAVDSTTVDAAGKKSTQVVPVGTKNYVQRAFGLSVDVTTGFANLSTTPTAIERTAFGGSTSRWVNPAEYPSGQAPFVQLNATASSFRYPVHHANFTVRLPSTAVNGDGFNVYVNATTDLQAVGAPIAQYRAVGPAGGLTVTLDDLPPVFALDSGTQGVNRTGFNGGPTYLSTLNATQRVLFGPATDAGSGVASVEVRVIDVTEGKTYNNVTRDWESGERSYWAKAGLRARDGTGALYWFFGPDDTGQTLFRDILTRSNQYRVDVRGVDRVGLAADVASFRFSFDADAPKFVTGHAFTMQRSDGQAVTNTTTAGAAAPTTPGFVSYKGRVNTFHYSARITDDVCIRNVDLVFEAPSGRVTRESVFNRSTACPTTGTDLFSIKVDGASSQKFPVRALNESGNTTTAGVYRVYMEATDASGKKFNGTQRFYFRVIDDFPAQLRNAYFRPGTAGVGGFSTLEVDVFENYRMGRVEVRMFRNNLDGSYDPNLTVAFGNLTPSASIAANGTGTWTISTEAMNLTLVSGSYTAQVRVLDERNQGAELCPFGFRFENRAQCAGIQLAVTEGAPPSITFKSPSRTAAFVNGTVRIHAEVASTQLSESGITLRTGDADDNLTIVTPETTRIRIANKTAGYNVYLNATVANDSRPFVINLSVVDLTGVRVADGFNVSVDRTPPVVTGAFAPTVVVDNTTFVRATSKLTVNATDTGSGIASVRCRVGSGAFTNCASGFTFPAGGSDGPFVVNFTATDRAGNDAAGGSVNVTLDRTAPVIKVTKAEADFVVTVTDATSGVAAGGVTVFFAAVNDSATVPSTYQTLVMDVVTGDTFRASLPNGTQVVRYYVEATDQAGNKGNRFTATAPGRLGDDPEKDIDDPTKPPVGNRPPVLTLTGPTAGQVVKTPVVVTWTSSDPDGDPLTVALSYRGADGAANVIATDLDATSGRFPWDTSTLADGSFTLIVRLSDGTLTAERNVTFTLRNRETFSVVRAPDQAVTVGQTVSFAFNVDATKPVNAVKAVYLRNGVPLGPAETLDTVVGGAYGATFSPTDAGTYVIQAIVEYDDGTRDGFTVGSVVVQGSTKEIIETVAFWSTQLVTLLALGSVTLALAAYAAFGRWKQ